MKSRIMRILVMFDLPMETQSDSRAYRVFRKNLISEGFVMLQKSVYSKMVLNDSSARLVVEGLRKNKPANGMVCALKVTETQFANMDFILGEFKTDIINSADKVVVL